MVQVNKPKISKAKVSRAYEKKRKQDLDIGGILN
jgi:hypothetical protein